MQSSSDKSQGNQDESGTNCVEDSLMMTINYLRARLLSERSISKAAKERTDELAMRVKELEQQLKVVTLQRKRAEKAALDVFSYLHCLGVREVYGSESNEEESQCESNMDNDDTTKEDKNFRSLEMKGSDKEPFGSEPESTPSSGRSLSWKGHKERTRLLEEKCINSAIRSRTSLIQVNSSPRHHLGKSCRQIKRREPRSTGEESRSDSGKSDAQESNVVDCLDHCLDYLDFRSEELKTSSEKCGDRGFRKEEISHSFHAQAQECDASSSTHEREHSGEMKRALKHQAQLIRCYEAQEKAQRDWEEKYGENDDSCEPGSHSDVTEERDEGKTAVPNPVEIDGCHGSDNKAGKETTSKGRKESITHFNSFKLSPVTDQGCSEKHEVSEIQATRSPAPDFAFTVENSNQSEPATRHPLHAGDVGPSDNDSDFYQHQSLRQNNPRALIPYAESARMRMALEALQEAKLLIKQKMCLPETRVSVGRAIPANNREADWLKLPVGCPGLFRVPTELEGPSKLLSSDFPSELTRFTLNPRTPAIQDHQYISGPTGSGLGIPSGDPFSKRQPGYDFHFNTNVSTSSKFNLLSNSTTSFPDFFPRVSSNQMMFSQYTGNETGIPPSGYPSNHDVRPNIYR